MSEMAQTATRLVVLGRGRLISESSVEGLHRPRGPRAACWSARRKPRISARCWPLGGCDTRCHTPRTGHYRINRALAGTAQTPTAYRVLPGPPVIMGAGRTSGAGASSRMGSARGTLAWAPEADPLGEGNSAATRLTRFPAAGAGSVAGLLLGGRGRLPVDVVALRRVEEPGVHRVAAGAQVRRHLARRWEGRQATGAGQPRQRDAPSGPGQRLTLVGSHEVDPSWV